jgi:hypothetical protein
MEAYLSVVDPTTRDSYEPAAWRVNDWRRQVPISRSKFYQERDAGRIETVKCGSSTLVTTAPKEYLAALRRTAA